MWILKNDVIYKQKQKQKQKAKSKKQRGKSEEDQKEQHVIWFRRPVVLAQSLVDSLPLKKRVFPDLRQPNTGNEADWGWRLEFRLLIDLAEKIWANWLTRILEVNYNSNICYSMWGFDSLM